MDISRSQVSELAKGLDEQVETWRRAPIKQEYPCLVVDALSEKVRHGADVLSDPVLMATGISKLGHRKHLGVWCRNTESRQTCSEVFGDRRNRGLQDVRCVVSDKHRGIQPAVARHFQAPSGSTARRTSCVKCRAR